MSDELQGALCVSPNTCTTVEYLAGALGDTAINSGYEALTAALAAADGETIVAAYSQGGMIATLWLENNAAAGDPSPSTTTFVLFGNPQRLLNGQAVVLGTGSATPSDTDYTVIDISREYDGESDVPNDLTNLLAVANAIAGYLYVHTDYTDVDVTDGDNYVQTVGNTTYVLVPTENLPLLEPLRAIGLTALADELNGPLKTIIDSAYDRSGYTLLSDDEDAQAVIASVFGSSDTDSDTDADTDSDTTTVTTSTDSDATTTDA
ncbi:MAG: PE-PPE domain-containing protein, partial [Gordonia sp. (in: high G+C Gram-positive bacteria)]